MTEKGEEGGGGGSVLNFGIRILEKKKKMDPTLEKEEGFQF